MASQTVDLLYELRSELNWDKEFALSACKEYSRWLQLRANTGDFQACKLLPSRVVAMVWNLHRQWTMDYERTCTALGGFVHHYPPAMRMSFSREQGYAVTFQTYKSHFKEDPPASCWEPPICPSRSSLGSSGLITKPTERSTDAQALLISSASPPSKTEADSDIIGRDTSASRVHDQRGGGFSRPRRRAVNASRQSLGILDGKGFAQPEDESGDIPNDSAAFSAIVEPLSLSQALMISNDVNAMQRADGQDNENSRDVYEKESKLTRSQGGGRKVHEGFVLRPLAPGQKRRRGRPSLSEYVPISEVDDDRENGREAALISQEKDGVGKSVASPTTVRSKRTLAKAKGRKASSSKPQVPTIAPRPSREATRYRSESSRSLKKDATLTEGTRAAGLGNGLKLNEHKNAAKTGKKATNGSVRIGPDGNLLRRPRGRPRKDGSWPISRAKRRQTAQARSGGPAASGSEDHAAQEQGRYMSTTLVPRTVIEHGDAPIPSLETDVGVQMLDTTEPNSN